MGVAVGELGPGVSSTKPCWQGGKGMVTLPTCQVNPYHMHAATSSPVLAEKCLQPLLHLSSYLLLNSVLACPL